MKVSAIVFGSRGGIGQATCDHLSTLGYLVHGVDRSQLNWTDPDCYQRLTWHMQNLKPTVIVNCVGLFQDGTTHCHHDTFNVNFGSNWNIIRYLDQHCRDQHMTMIMVGSSSHNGGRAAYPLYSASKAAVYNLWQSCQRLFADTPIAVSLVNPQRTRTPMNAAHHDPTLTYHEPSEVAAQIAGLAQSRTGVCIDMKLEATP